MRSFKLTALVLIFSLPLLGAGVKVEVVNPGSNERAKEVVAVDWDALSKKLGALTANNARVLAPSGETLLSQAADNDDDGKVDELLFVTGLAGGETKRFEVVADSSLDMPETKARTYARYVPERKGDYAWENELVAFRAYGPGLVKGNENCGFDAWMKRVEYPIIDKWYAMEKKARSYHIDMGEGYDGYHVGASLGCGGSAVWSAGAMFRSNVYVDHQDLVKGPIRSSFELSYGPWKVGRWEVTETKRITIEVGKQLFRVDEQFYVNGKPSEIEIVIGLSTHGGRAEAFETEAKGYLYCWEKIDKHHLGTAIVAPPELIQEYWHIDSKDKDEGHALFIVDVPADGEFTYWAGFGWERAGKITTQQQWEDYLVEFVANQSAPIRVQVK